MKRKTVLTIELERMRIITGNRRRQVYFCKVCGTTCEFVNTAEAMEMAKFIGVKSPDFFHFYRTPENKIYVCLNSILESC